MFYLKLAVPAVIASLLNTLANMLWKLRLNAHPLQTDGFVPLLRSVLNLHIIGGMALYGVSMLTYFYLMSNYRLSDIVPYLATTYIFNFIVAYFVFGEAIAVKQMVGLALILVGIVVGHLNVS